MQSAPQHISPGNFCGPGRKRQRKKEKLRKKEGKSKKGNGRRKSYKMRRGFFFSFHFSIPLEFVLGLPKWEFSTHKNEFHARKNDFAPSEKYSSYAPGLMEWEFCFVVMANSAVLQAKTFSPREHNLHPLTCMLVKMVATFTHIAFYKLISPF